MSSYALDDVEQIGVRRDLDADVDRFVPIELRAGIVILGPERDGGDILQLDIGAARLRDDQVAELL